MTRLRYIFTFQHLSSTYDVNVPAFPFLFSCIYIPIIQSVGSLNEDPFAPFISFFVCLQFLLLILCFLCVDLSIILVCLSNTNFILFIRSPFWIFFSSSKIVPVWGLIFRHGFKRKVKIIFGSKDLAIECYFRIENNGFFYFILRMNKDIIRYFLLNFSSERCSHPFSLIFFSILHYVSA